MALYEVGNCFFHGWGLPHPDYPMAVSYFKLAAESGDKDAQERESAQTTLEQSLGGKADIHSQTSAA
jgi:TPR repeat protein